MAEIDGPGALPDRGVLTVDERRTITIPVPGDVNVVNGLTIAFRSAFNDGFEIADASIRTTGQRDPIVTAIEIVLRKTAKQQPVEARDVDHTADRAR